MNKEDSILKNNLKNNFNFQKIVKSEQEII
jgi:hypothetical protein